MLLWYINNFFIKYGLEKLIFYVFVDSGQEMLIDIDGQPKENVLEHLIKVVGKSK